jgi:hypothetical protein
MRSGSGASNARDLRKRYRFLLLGKHPSVIETLLLITRMLPELPRD